MCTERPPPATSAPHAAPGRGQRGRPDHTGADGRRRHIRHQFLAEAVLLAALGGTAGAITGALATLATAALHGWPPIIPAQATAAGLAIALIVGASSLGAGLNESAAPEKSSDLRTGLIAASD